MKKIFILSVLSTVLSFSKVLGQDLQLNLNYRGSDIFVAGKGNIEVSIANTLSSGSWQANKVAVVLSTSGTTLKFTGNISDLPGGSVCTFEDNALVVTIPAGSEGYIFNVEVEGVSPDVDIIVGGVIDFYNDINTCDLGGMPLVGDQPDNNSSYTTVTVVAATPVTLISFTGRAEGSIAVLDWATAEETEFSHFEIESSADALSFQKVGEVFAKGSNNNYTFSTAQNEDLVYYRLKMVDHDGSFAYSKIIPVSLDESTAPSFLVYPNPTVDYLQIKNKEAGVVRIIDVTGKQIRNQKVDAGIQVIDVKNLREGVYYGWLNEQSFKFVKK
ncbi:hypothetical protein Lbys_0081 [Leadbetterella byssophila DSM 17132]|uniref:Secretion system C-terminal sorting domain-containing protein n=1 Tax=Leadbetterella byssophila (strain DSM 17132 / JCM 16389 / KACC 11308 / NBRC 106382 / 4M15) TaxID=649349 RepID=E4RS61_LEAB4|nr:T9SS type A sorting domain-containing protein [Leadbetterella byssophila]ADQ15877.1 hypothetical protein Lbys_0081 [Leadbetterella byssophila DSM 17132]